MNAHALVKQAMALHEAGQLPQAREMYGVLLEADPKNIDALQLLGFLELQSQRWEAALALYTRAIAIKPQPAFHLYAGEALYELEKIPQAHEHLQLASRKLRNHGEPWFYLGLTQRRLKQDDAAVESLKRAVRLAPAESSYLSFLQQLLQLLERTPEIEPLLRELLRADPHNFPALETLAKFLTTNDRYSEATELLERRLTSDPDNADLHFLKGQCAKQANNLTLALNCCQRACQLRPAFLAAMNLIACTLVELDRFNEAVAIHCEILKIDPDYIPSLINTAGALIRQGKQGFALDFLRRVVATTPENPGARSGLLFVLNYLADQSPESVAREHREFGELLERTILPRENAPIYTPKKTGERIRIGFVSADFRSHSVAFWIEPLLRQIDRKKFSLHAFYNHCSSDRVTKRLQPLFDTWDNLHGKSSEKIEETVFGRSVDVLVDLSGHSAGHLLPLFARRAAPVQMTMLGYPNTTGTNRIDFRITDQFADPVGQTENFHAEKILRMPRCAWCYQPPENSPPIQRTPQSTEAGPTFGCFNNLAKLQPIIIDTWARLLRETPGSRLYVKSGGMQDPFLQKYFSQLFIDQDVPKSALVFEGRKSRIEEHLSCYLHVDVALDPYPYHGTTTTAEALWMGVPVVSLAGRDHRCRVGASLLSIIGHPEWIASSPEDYIAKAKALVADRSTLKKIHLSLRDEMLRSPLLDAPGYARDFENTVLAAIEEILQRQPTESLALA